MSEFRETKDVQEAADHGRNDFVIAGYASSELTDEGEVIGGNPVGREDIPMLWRRRLLGIELTAVRCALGASSSVASATDLVFVSRHGNLARTQHQLELLGGGEPPSPLEFSLSVHNALAGMTDLLRGDQTGHTSIAAGQASLAMGLLEVQLRLMERPDVPILFLCVEQPIPQVLVSQTDPGDGGTVLALLVQSTCSSTWCSRMARTPSEHLEMTYDSERDARILIDSIRSRKDARICSGSGFDWTLEHRH